MFGYLKHSRKVIKRYMSQHQVDGHKKAYIKDKIALIKKTAKEYDVPFLWMLFDCIGVMIFHGESSEYYVQEEMYKYNRKEKKKRLTVLRAFKLDYKYNKKATEEEKQRLFNKKLFNTYYKDFIKRAWCFSTDETKESLIRFITDNGSVICKPYNLSWGHGIFILNKEDITDEIIQKLLSEPYIIEEVIKQHPQIKAIHPQSVNTLRIFSIIDREGVPHVALPIFRAGLGDSVTDNTSSGGLYFIVDKDTGIVELSGRTERCRTRYLCHPDTGVQVIGMKIPFYDEIVEMVKKAALVTPTLRYVGWDVAISENGPVLIEGNIEYAATNQGIDGKYYEAKQYL